MPETTTAPAGRRTVWGKGENYYSLRGCTLMASSIMVL